MAFPTFTSKAITCSEEPIDDTITSKSEGGYSQTRPRNTRQRRKFTVKMILSDSNWITLKAFDTTVGGWTIFDWIHPTTGVTVQVRFVQRPKNDPVRISGTWLQSVDFVLEQA